MEDERRVSEALDPMKFVEHTTRTALLLEQLARDVKDLRERVSGLGLDSLRASMSSLERDCAVLKTDMSSRSESNRTRLGEVEERLRWLSRLVAGAFITGGIGGLVALLWKMATP